MPFQHIHNMNMKNINNKIKYNRQNGMAILLAVVVSSVVLIMAMSLANVAMKELILTSTTSNSDYAFYSADTGADCALYWDLTTTTSNFVTSSPANIYCAGGANSIPIEFTNSGSINVYHFTFVINTKEFADVTLTKDMSNGNTTVVSLGYNTNLPNSSGSVERREEITYTGPTS